MWFIELSSVTSVYRPFLIGCMLRRTADMLNYFLLRLVGPKMGELKVPVKIISSFLVNKPYSQYIRHNFLSIIYVTLIAHQNNSLFSLVVFLGEDFIRVSF